MKKTNPPQLLIRADAAAAIGSGHVMRCLALAQVWQQNGGEVTFAMAKSADYLKERLESEEISVTQIEVDPGSVEDVKRTVDIAAQKGAEWVVLDGYNFGASHQKALKEVGMKVLFIDDYGHAKHYSADIVLNQNIYANESIYSSRESYTRLLLGVQYVLLRREFWPWREWTRETQAMAQKILVSMGGSDPNNVTCKVLRALQCVHVNKLEVKIVLSSDNPHRDILGAIIHNLDCNVALETNVSDMAKLMAWADFAISAGGSSNWEMAFMGLPNLIIVTSENQVGIAQGLHNKEIAINLGWHDSVDPLIIANNLDRLVHNHKDRLRRSQNGKDIIDGNGAARVCEEVIRAKPRGAISYSYEKH